MEKETLHRLLERYYSNVATHEEREQLFMELTENGFDEEWTQILQSLYQNTPAESNYDPQRWRPVIRKITNPPARLIPLPSNGLKWWASIAAAAIILIVSLIFILNQPKGPNSTNMAGITKEITAPSSSRAVITLADGRKVVLDSIAQGTLAVQNNVSLVKTKDGKLVYHSATVPGQSALQYNTLTNPRGSRVVDMVLSDGSHVWLNAGSSLTYPVAFTGEERKVTISGEAYFEVAHDAYKPFRVSKGATTITVLGTHFNMNAYEDEEDIKVTLLEGSVAVKREASGVRQMVVIKPGEQAVVRAANNQSLLINKQPNLEQVMAWKNGRFQFEGEGLEEVMRQIARWYDVEIAYQSFIPQKTFNGEIDRQVPVSKVLEMLQYVGVHFKIEGKKIIVTP